MINSLLSETCNILRREKSEDKDTEEWGEYQYIPSDDINCLMVRVTGEKITDETGNEIVVREVLLMTDEIKEADKIKYDDHEYKIIPNGIEKRKSIIAGDIEYYRVAVQRTREYAEDEVEIIGGY